MFLRLHFSVHSNFFGLKSEAYFAFDIRLFTTLAMTYWRRAKSPVWSITQSVHNISWPKKPSSNIAHVSYNPFRK